MCINRKTSNDFDVSNGYFANELAVLREQLETRTFVSPVTDDVV